MDEVRVRLFVSSPSDVRPERDRVSLVAERLSGAFEGVARIEAIRWEESYYGAAQSFQEQIDAAVHSMADVDIVVCVLWGRIGLKLNPAVWRRQDGTDYESGTVFEYETALARSLANDGAPDVYLFKKSLPVSYRADFVDEDMEQHQRLETVWARWTQTEGYNAAAYNQFTDLEDFEAQIETCLRQWLERRGVITSGPVWDRRLQGSPFRGLAPFDQSHASVFFGREIATARIIARLRSTSFLLIIGASGAGKSSLLRAGLLPRIVRPGVMPEVDIWRTALVLPGSDPAGRLADALFEDGGLGPELRSNGIADARALAAALTRDPGALAEIVKKALDTLAQQRAIDKRYDTPRPARLLVAIDQLEWLFAEATAEDVEIFLDAVRGLVDLQLAAVVATLRSDAYAGLQSVASLVAMHEAGATYDLLPPGPVELEDIVTRPVAACHPPLAFETTAQGRSLADVLVADATGTDALPLLEVTLDRLYQAQEQRYDGVLRFADYPGLDQAVTEAAAEAFATIDDTARAALADLVVGLIHDISTDPTTNRRTLTLRPLDRHRFEAGQPARKALIDTFIAHRLLTAENRRGVVEVRPVHEALLRAWPEASAIVTESEAIIRARRTLEPLVEDWLHAAHGGRDEHLLTSTALLASSSQLKERLGHDLPDTMRDFIDLSLVAAERRREAEERRHSQIMAATGRMRIRSAPLYLPLVAVLLAIATVVRFIDPVGLQTMRSVAFDAYQQISPAAYDPDLAVRVVDIDAASLAKYGQWPWPRTKIRDLLNDLIANGAAAVAFDILFAESDRLSPEQIVKTLPAEEAAALAPAVASQPSYDQQFADALAKAPSVLGVSLVNDDTTPFVGKSGFAIAGDDPRPFIPAFLGATGSLPVLEQAARGLGATNWAPDRDQIIRRVNLIFRVGETLVPSLVSEALRVAQGANTIVLKASNASGQSGFGRPTGLNHILIGGAEVPTDANGTVALRFRHTKPQDFIPAWKVLSGTAAQNDIAGRIILVGTSVPGLEDIRPTPIDVAVPGVEIHEQAIENILAARYLTRPDYMLAIEEAIVIVIGLLLTPLMPHLPARWLVAFATSLGVALLVGGWAAYNYAGVLVDPLYPIVALFCFITAVTFYIYRHSERQRSRIKSVFTAEPPTATPTTTATSAT
jgi:CHASE2 domain-containing sensor protein